MFNKIFSLLIIACLMPINLYAAGGCNEYISCNYSYCEDISDAGEFESCEYQEDLYINQYRIYNCKICADGYTQEKQTITTPDGCMVDYYICEKYCPSCTGGCPDTAWETIGSYQRKYTRYCDCGTCRNSTAKYQCSPGYYGSGTSCTQCPEAPSTYTNSALTTRARGTSAAGTTSQNSCYLTAGTYYDASGTVSITSTCTY